MTERDTFILLRKYMKYVQCMQGNTFIPPVKTDYILTRFGFTKREQAILNRMDEAIQQEVDNSV